MTSAEAKQIFFRATPALVLALVGLFWFANEDKRNTERDAAISAMNAIAESVKDNSARISEHDIRLAVIKDRLERDYGREEDE